MSNLNIEEISNNFLKVFFHVLEVETSQLIKFYQENSTLSFGIESENYTIYEGKENIQKFIENSISKKTNIYDAISYLIDENKILIFICGIAEDLKKLKHKFTRTFILCPLETQDGYFIQNDIIKKLKNFGTISESNLKRNIEKLKSKQNSKTFEEIILESQKLLEKKEKEQKKLDQKKEKERSKFKPKYSYNPIDEYDHEVIPENSIYVSNLRLATKDYQLGIAFTNFGNVVYAESRSGKSFGFVEFDSKEAVERVLKEKEIIFDGRVLKIRKFY
ncbi:hypothetical protein M0811_03517 [Anaeramoeba ignava]|uniref:Uncharacterized protein n=1 Tax=Anaeramoeba ignava TaxID=1746090 RepID=A0A9Q0L5Q8_ANAIG|nr:hypothetical protein M0811_03517 [Anaeramoeba ignava]